VLLHVQFPILDARAFLNRPTPRLPAPTWPAPSESSFVRSFGKIVRRPSGGVRGWIQESDVCEVSSLRACNPGKLRIQEYPKPLKFRYVYKRFYFDGAAVGKLDLGFSIPVFRKKPQLFEEVIGNSAYLSNFVSNIGRLEFRWRRSQDRVPLFDLGPSLSTYYAQATSPHTAGNVSSATKCVGVHVGKPIVVVESDFRDKGGEIIISTIKGYHRNKDIWIGPPWLVNGADVWVTVAFGRHTRSTLRLHRIILSRLHTEIFCFTEILNRIQSKEIEPDQGSRAHDRLMKYLTAAVRRINGDMGYSSDSTASVAQVFRDLWSPGRIDALISRLADLQLGEGVISEVTRLLELARHMVTINVTDSEVTMGDVYRNISNSTIISRSLLEGSLNKVTREAGEDTAQALRKIGEVIASSGNKEAAELFDQLNEEIQRSPSRKSLLRNTWNGIVAALPAVTAIAGVTAAIAKLLG
jgi:hypothetical protein